MTKVQTFDAWFEQHFSPSLRGKPKIARTIRTVAYGAWLDRGAEVEAALVNKYPDDPRAQMWAADLNNDFAAATREKETQHA